LKYPVLSLVRCKIPANFRVIYIVQTLGWILLLTLLVLFPVTWMKPSPRLNKVVVLRDKARALGIKVTLTPLKLKNATPIHGVAYRWFKPADAPVMPGCLCLLRKSLEEVRPVWEQLDDDWALAQGQKNLLTSEQLEELGSWLASLPENVFAVEWGSATLAVWWDERTDDPDILEAWHEQVQKLFVLPSKQPNFRELEKRKC